MTILKRCDTFGLIRIHAPLPEIKHMSSKKRVTLSDVSRAAGVSMSSVSMILNNRSDVSFTEETIEKVRYAARVLGYKAPSRHRKPLLSQKKTILVVTPNVSNSYYSNLVQAIQQAAVAHDFSTLCFNTYREAAKEEEVLSMAEAVGVSGIIMAMPPQNTALVEKLNRSTPIVVIGDRRANLNVDTVEIDNYRAGTLVGQHMLDLGHRHIAFISTTLNQHNAMRVRRLQGLRDAYAAAGPHCSVTVFSQDITPAEELNEIGIEHRVGHDLAMKVLKKQTNITGLVSVNDSVAYGVLDALTEAGLRVPEDYSVCGFDNLPFSRSLVMDLTTVDHHMEDKGHSAFNILYERICGSNMANNITRVEFTHFLVKGRTSGPARTLPEGALGVDGPDRTDRPQDAGAGDGTTAPQEADGKDPGENG